MKYKLEIGLIFFLLLFFISLGDPFVYIGGILRRVPLLQTPSQYTCIAKVVPETSRVLFLSKTDGSLDWNTYNYWFMQSQYNLVPRVMAYSESAVDMADFKWFLANALDTQTIDQMARAHQLQVVQMCDKITILKSAR